ncbi:DUF4920 domain-containing protein [Nannocystis bainbridge]|uniref:DUF4920 domain-containing protein n=1 Tax=Nannocystis bainbridge TaxID=2995303 RepID=A0ABT5E164_9BACT|nr:DUF4920 domain-containing protein [Nannocystis bainbridge]MDC0718456.1 DUF4920 domain-containing protein [Nannocystis bainbridge]
MHVRHAILASLLGCTVVACQGGAAAPAAQPAAEAAKVADPAKTAEPPKAEDKVAVADKHEAEEGCVYAGQHKEGHDDEADCPHGGAEGTPNSGEPGHFGAAFALKDAKPLGPILAAGKDALPKDAVQISGTVDSVCQKKGCWMVVKDGDQEARILMKDHGFTVPMDTKGKPVFVEGTLEARTFTEAQVKHLEKDAGKDPAAASGERTEYVLTASGVKIQNS